MPAPTAEHVVVLKPLLMGLRGSKKKGEAVAHAQFQGVRGEPDHGRRCSRGGGYMGHTCVKFEGR